MKTDGELVIKTSIQNKEFDRQLSKLEADLEKFQKEKHDVQVKIDTNGNELDNMRAKLKAINEEKERISQRSSFGINSADASRLDILNAELEQMLPTYNKLSAEQDVLNSKYIKASDKVSDIGKKIDIVNSKKKQLSEKIKLQNFKDVENSIGKIGKSATSSAKKISRMILGIFSIGSAYMIIGSAIGTLSSSNEQLSADIENIRYGLASALLPIIQTIVAWVYKLMSYINFIWKVWTGNELFSKKPADNLSKANKQAEKLQRTIAGFDEMNVLGSNTSTAKEDKTGVSTSDFTMDEAEIPSWVKWIAENKDKVLGFLKTLGIVIAGLKLASLLANLIGIAKPLGAIFSVLSGMSALSIFALVAGIAITLTGLMSTIKYIIAFIKDPSWENFNGILAGLGTTLAGVTLIMLAFNAANPVAWIVGAIAVITLLVAGLSELVRGFVNDKAAILDTKTAQEELNKATEEAKTATDDYVSAIDNAENAQRKLKEAQDKTGLSGKDLYDQVQKGTLDYKDMTEEQKEVYKAYLENDKAQKKVKESSETLTKAKAKEKQASIENQLAIAKESGKYDEFKESIVKAYQNGELSAGEARDAIERAMAGMSDSSRDTFKKDLPNDIKDGLDPQKYESNGQKLSRWFSNLFSNIGRGIKGAFDGIKSLFGFAGGGVTTSRLSNYAKGGVVYSKVPKLASGGIINIPGSGVPLGRAIGGEAGQEGIIPLTDSQQMALLGEAIGKYITVNLTNTTQLDGRTISRKVETISANKNFAMNR